MAKSRCRKDEEKVEELFHDESAQFNLSSQYYQETPTQNLSFINLTASSGGAQDEGKRRQVRSQVMINIHQQKQMQEHSEWQEQRAILARSPPPLVIQEIPTPACASTIHPAENGIGVVSQQAVARPALGAVQDEGLQHLDGGRNPTSNLISYQSVHESMIMDAQSLRDINTWASNPMSQTITPLLTENMTWDIGSSNMGSVHQNRSPHAVGWLAEETESRSELLSSQSVQSSPPQALGIELTSPSRGRIDPFDTMPCLANGRAEALIYHYTKVLVRSMLAVAVDPEDRWFGYSLTDSAMFNGTMMHAASHITMLTGTTNLGDPVLLKWEAIKLINIRLGDPVMGVSDEQIGAVVSLLLFENQSANVELSNIHMKGLCQMLRLRGGLQNLGLAGVLKRKILWADLCNSMYSHHEPRFDNKPSISRFERANLPPTTTTIINTSRPYENELREIFASLRALSGPISRTVVAIDDIYFVDRRVVVLISKANPDFNMSSDEHDSLPEHRRTAYQAAVAAQIYIYLFLRETLVPSPIFSILVSRLSKSLRSSREGSNMGGRRAAEENNRNDNISLWLLVLGALAADGREEKHEFEMDLRTLRSAIGIRTFIEFLEKLKGIAWIEYKMYDKLLKLWSDVQGTGSGALQS